MVTLQKYTFPDELASMYHTFSMELSVFYHTFSDELVAFYYTFSGELLGIDGNMGTINDNILKQGRSIEETVDNPQCAALVGLLLFLCVWYVPQVSRQS